MTERQETIVLRCTRRGDSCSMCPQKAEHCLRELQRWAQGAAIRSDPRNRHEPLTLQLLPPRILCASAGHYPYPLRSLWSTPLPGSRVPRTNSLREHMACLRMLQCQASLCCQRLSLHSNYDPSLSSVRVSKRALISCCFNPLLSWRGTDA